MAEYRLTNTDVVIRAADGASIPNDPYNRDRIEYNAWFAAGGVPDPYVEPPEPPPSPTSPGQEVAFDHENRIRSLEGVPPMTPDVFAAKMRGK